ncbi:MAG: phosphoribosylglycinamide synthetase C domain-containing protein [Nitrososphaeria archaeon]|jgi:phosphoribosylamine--glycine ligase
MVEVLVVGKGGRENSIGFVLQKDSRIDRVYIVPGNAGTYLIPKCMPLMEFPRKKVKATSEQVMEFANKTLEKVELIDEILSFAHEKSIKQVWVGPEDCLSLGIVDKGLEMGVNCIVGALKHCMKLEGSKCWQKDLMKKANVPIPRHRNFRYPNDFKAALDFVDEMYNDKKNVVVKYDGYAEGKGTIVCSSRDQARWAVRAIMNERRIGECILDPNNGNIEIDERLEVLGEESFFVLKNEKTMTSFGTACEDKKAYDENSPDLNFFRKFVNTYYKSLQKLGPTSKQFENVIPLTINQNTGGMVGVAQSPWINEENLEDVMGTIVKPTFRMFKEMTGNEWKGIGYFGLLLVKEDGKVVRKVSEFNGRDGDTETELRMPLLETSLFDIGNAYLEDKLDQIEIKWKNAYTFGLTLVSGRIPRTYQADYEDLEIVAEKGIGFIKDQNLGYPWPHLTNQPITGIDKVAGVQIFGSGISLRKQNVEQALKSDGLDFCTSGGRTMVLVGEGKTIEEAERSVYEEQKKIFFKNKRYRKTHEDWGRKLDRNGV